MQNTMLDNTVSSNSQELFDLNAEHNGEACIASLDPKDERENKFWFTVAMLCTIYGVAEQTIRDNLKSLGDDGELGLPEISGRRINIEDSWGVPHPTTIYNLTVLNKLGMCCFRGNKKAKEIRDKFNDVLVKHETQVQPTIFDYARALIAEKERSDALEAQNKALEAELTSEKEAHEKDNVDFRIGLDIINAEKAQISSTREATAMATASAKSRECKRLTAENAELKDAVGRGTNWRTVNMMTDEWIRNFGHAPDWHKLKKFSADLPEEMKPVKDVEVKVVLRNGGEKISLVNRYHREAWAKYRESEENLRVSAESRRDAKILDLSTTNTEVEYF